MEAPLNFYKSKPFERICGDCDMCCKWLVNDVYGHLTTPASPCHFLGKGCTIYEDRPNVCRDYYCGYIQNIIPEWMKPTITGIIVSPERWGTQKEYQMLRVTECDGKLTAESLSWLIQFSIKNNTGLLYNINGRAHKFGPSEFLKFFDKI